jgi:predicted transcriptional regulator of viral defense system
MKKTRIKRVLELVQERGILRPVELDEFGIPREYLILLYRRGKLDRIGRGLYVTASHELTEHHTMAAVSKRVPHGVICLLSALQFHGLTTQLPRRIWMAVDRREWKPNIELPVEFVFLSDEAFTAGIDEHVIEGVKVKVYSPAKTVVDCFKFRNKIGMDVAIEALRDCRRQKKCTADELWRYAKICRQGEVMRPYLTVL